MAKLQRYVSKLETLELKPCPFCKGDVTATDCGYNSFNPGTARCQGKCKREWHLGFVEDEWAAGIVWNSMQSTVKQVEKLEKKLDDIRIC